MTTWDLHPHYFWGLQDSRWREDLRIGAFLWWQNINRVKCIMKFMLLDLGQKEVDESMSIERSRSWFPFWALREWQGILGQDTLRIRASFLSPTPWCKLGNGPQSFCNLGTGFVEDSVSMNQGRGMGLGWFEHIAFIGHFISITIASAPPQTIRH